MFIVNYYLHDLIKKCSVIEIIKTTFLKMILNDELKKKRLFICFSGLFNSLKLEANFFYEQ